MRPHGLCFRCGKRACKRPFGRWVCDGCLIILEDMGSLKPAYLSRRRVEVSLADSEAVPVVSERWKIRRLRDLMSKRIFE